MISGGVVSLGPPVGGLSLPQEIKVKIIKSDGKHSVNRGGHCRVFSGPVAAVVDRGYSNF